MPQPITHIPNGSQACGPSKADVIFVIPAINPTFENEFGGTLILAQLLEDAGIGCRILRFWEASREFDDYQVFEDALLDRILEHPVRIVSFYGRCDNYHIMIGAAQRVKEACPDVEIVFGGPQATLTAEATLEAFPWIDYICCGEGETTVVPFFSSILAGAPDLSVRGLAYRADAGRGADENSGADAERAAATNRTPDVGRELGTCVMTNPLPTHVPTGYRIDYRYYELIPNEVLEDGGPVSLDVGRGCPFSCTFCSTKTFWQRDARFRDPGDIVDEIEYVTRKYGNGIFSFQHDLFTSSRRNVLAFCDELERRDLHIRWSCSSRIDTIDEEMILRMKAVGLDGLYFGVETGSQRMQGIIDKNLHVERVLPLAAFLKEQCIEATFSFIYGFPDETEDDLRDTLKLIFGLMDKGYKKIQLHELAMENGTQIYIDCHDRIEWGNASTDLALSFGASKYEGMIKAHPDIFPIYFGLADTLSVRMPYMPDLIRCYKRTPRSMRFALELEGGDPLRLYAAFEDACREQLAAVRAVGDYNLYDTAQWMPLNIKMLDRFFESLEGCEHYEALHDLYRYEVLVLQMLGQPHLPDQTIEYRFDWRALKLGEPFANVAAGSTTLQLLHEGALVRTRIYRDESAVVVREGVCERRGA